MASAASTPSAANPRKYVPHLNPVENPVGNPVANRCHGIEFRTPIDHDESASDACLVPNACLVPAMSMGTGVEHIPRRVRAAVQTS